MSRLLKLNSRLFVNPHYIKKIEFVSVSELYARSKEPGMAPLPKHKLTNVATIYIGNKRYVFPEKTEEYIILKDFARRGMNSPELQYVHYIDYFIKKFNLSRALFKV